MEVTDVVCGMTFPEEGAEDLGAEKHVHEGRTYWFCCPTCKQEFVNAPASFLDRAPPTS